MESAVERQGEQIERLEDLVRELVLTAESLRREIAGGGASAAQSHEETSQGKASEG